MKVRENMWNVYLLEERNTYYLYNFLQFKMFKVFNKNNMSRQSFKTFDSVFSFWKYLFSCLLLGNTYLSLQQKQKSRILRFKNQEHVSDP